MSSQSPGVDARPIPLAIVGPTAVGKSGLSMAVAAECGRRGLTVEIVSADSMAVYRGMDIGTAKPSAGEQSSVRHHLIDVADPAEDYTVAQYGRDVSAALVDIGARGAVPLLVGGTGLYVQAVLDDFEIPPRFPELRAEFEANPDTAGLFARLAELDPDAAARMEPNNRRRIIRALEVGVGSGRPFSRWGPGVDKFPPIPTRQIGCDRDRSALDQRIDGRYDAQIADGFVAEVAALIDDGQKMSRTARQALGYREILSHLEDGVDLKVAVDEAKRRTRRFARRQQRWFRRDTRIEWVDLGATDPTTLAVNLVDRMVTALGR